MAGSLHDRDQLPVQLGDNCPGVLAGASMPNQLWSRTPACLAPRAWARQVQLHRLAPVTASALRLPGLDVGQGRVIEHHLNLAPERGP